MLALGAAGAFGQLASIRRVDSGPKLGDPLDLTNATLVRKTAFDKMPALAREFPPGATPHTSLSLADPSFRWRAGYLSYEILRRGNYPDWDGINDSTELEAYPNALAIDELGISPFAMQDGMLTIRAFPMPERVRATLQPRLQNRTWVSGALNTWPFGQMWGVFALTAQAARGNPIWPAFWLLPTDLSWPPECDVFEWLGGLPTNYQFGVVTKDKAYPSNMNYSQRTQGPDWSVAPVTVVVDWGPERTLFYAARRGETPVLMNIRPTPADWTKPMYAVINLAIGSPNSWPSKQPRYDGKPDIPLPDEPWMKVRDFMVWDRPEYQQARAARQPT